MFPFEGNKLVACLPSIRITRLHWYYAAIRLPIKHLDHLLCMLVHHTLRKKKPRKDRQDLLSCRNISMSDVPWSSTPERFLPSCLIVGRNVAFCKGKSISPLDMEISELNPFNHMAYGPSSNCLRLKTPVTCCPPRLATSEWLVLTRWESHPLYVTTLLSRSPHVPY
jgi:hypothetical protein